MCPNGLLYSVIIYIYKCTSFWNLSNVNFFSISLKIHGSAEYLFINSECQQLAASRPDFTRIIRTSSLSSEMKKKTTNKQTNKQTKHSHTISHKQLIWIESKLVCIINIRGCAEILQKKWYQNHFNTKGDFTWVM